MAILIKKAQHGLKTANDVKTALNRVKEIDIELKKTTDVNKKERLIEEKVKIMPNVMLLTNDEVIEAAKNNRGWVTPDDSYTSSISYAKDGNFVNLSDIDKLRIMKMMQFQKKNSLFYPVLNDGLMKFLK